MDYPPHLTPAVEAKLKAEIAAFNQAQTLEELEENAEPKKDAPGYTEWKAQHGHNDHGQIGNGVNGYAEAEPDTISEDDAVKFEKPTFSKQIVLATLEIKELLSFRENQVWTGVMKNGLSVAECAQRLHIGERTVEEYIARAKAKVIEHFKDGIGGNDE